jgi:hypothetical protein
MGSWKIGKVPDQWVDRGKVETAYRVRFHITVIIIAISLQIK